MPRIVKRNYRGIIYISFFNFSLSNSPLFFACHIKSNGVLFSFSWAKEGRETKLQEQRASAAIGKNSPVDCFVVEKRVLLPQKNNISLEN